jgi:hypothetical protein
MCGAMFKPQRSKAKFCGTACRMRWYRIHKRWRVWKETEEGKKYYSTPCEVETTVAALGGSDVK